MVSSVTGDPLIRMVCRCNKRQAATDFFCFYKKKVLLGLENDFLIFLGNSFRAIWRHPRWLFL